jgi:hypothetical protein
MECGLCGSGICADEKFKKLKNGNINRHCYYGCTKARDKNCKCGYISEEELINQLVELIDIIDIDEIGIKEKIKSEVGISDKPNSDFKITLKYFYSIYTKFFF